ncbi:MAG: ABC-F family ATP-binding cassette domain-containing protein [Clostridia bacterium]|nr:ABC-F family ATP-binding cassette domain-containing protein [Clostridia bacterium]
MQRTLLEANGIVVRHGAQTVLDLDHLVIRDGERIGLIGENGAGKSTLLGVLSGAISPDSGTVRRLCPVALIRQQGETDAPITGQARSEFRAREGRAGLSGGELTRRRIAAALSQNAPLLMADEPTTDLDAEGVARLRDRLAARRGALLLVSHDRSLLNALCGRVWHLEDGRIAEFPGNYDDYRRELERRREFAQFEYDQYRAEASRLKAAAQKQAEWASSVKKAPKRMGNSEARLHTRAYTDSVLGLSHARQKLQGRLERLEVKQRPRDLPDIRMALGAGSPIQAKTALSLRCKRLTAGGATLLREARLELPTGARTALLGPNGCGKTTLLRAIAGHTDPAVTFAGTVRLNPGARVGVFDQDHARLLDMGKTALQNAMAASSLPESVARTVLARLNLPGDQVFKPVSVLSGGERAKVALARLMLGDFNLLILDEPTNHLDVFTLQALQALLAGYAGTLLFVSHDRAFAGAVATRLVFLEDVRLRAFEGTLSQYAAEQARDRDAEARKLQIIALEMRLAALAARMSAPKKGDKPEALVAEYDELAEELRQMKK